MEFCEVSAEKTLIWNTDLFPIEQTKIYEINIPVQNFSEKDDSAFVLMIFFDADKKHIDRRYKFVKKKIRQGTKIHTSMCSSLWWKVCTIGISCKL